MAKLSIPSMGLIHDDIMDWSYAMFNHFRENNSNRISKNYLSRI